MEDRIQKRIPVKLSLEELQGKAKEMSDLHLECDELQEQKKEMQKDLGSKIKVRQDRMHALAQIIHEGQEHRLIECQLTFIVETNTVEIRRADTGERIEVRAMTLEEREALRQGEFFENRSVETDPEVQPS